MLDVIEPPKLVPNGTEFRVDVGGRFVLDQLDDDGHVPHFYGDLPPLELGVLHRQAKVGDGEVSVIPLVRQFVDGLHRHADVLHRAHEALTVGRHSPIL